MNELFTPRELRALANINAALDEENSAVGPGSWADCGEVDVPVLLATVARLSQLVRTATRPHYAWPDPVPFPAHPPVETESQYYCLTARFPQQPLFLTWLDPNEDSDPPVWCEFDGDCYQATNHVVTHYWPAPVVDPPAAPAPGWRLVSESVPEAMPDEVYGFHPDADEVEKNAERCSQDVLVCYQVVTSTGVFWAHGLARLYLLSQCWYDNKGHRVVPIHWQPLLDPVK
jgi:hypothetical protein